MHLTLKNSLHCAADNVLRRVPLMLHRNAAGSMLVAGAERWSRYLPYRFFGSEPRERRCLGNYWAWQLPDALRRWRGAADITVARVDRMSAALFPTAEYLRVPDYIRMVAPVPASNRDFPSSHARRDLCHIRSKRLTWRVSHDTADLQTFIEQDYAPYIRTRYEDAAHCRSSRFLHRVFSKGGLLSVEQGGDPISRLLFAPEAGALSMYCLACVGGNKALLKQGALSGLYAFSFECARSLRLTSVDMRGCRPCLHDGLFRFKRKWGAAVGLHAENVHALLVRWNAANPVVLRFLAESPLIFCDGDGLSAIHADRVTPRLRLLTPGLRRLFTPRPDAPFGAWDEDRGDASAVHCGS